MNMLVIKNKKIFFVIAIIIVSFIIPTFSFWGEDKKNGKYWVESDGTILRDGWKLIDDDNDGIGN